EIRKQSGYNFLYNPKLIKKAHPVTIRLDKASLEEALQQCFAGQPLSYTISRNTVVVQELETLPSPAKQASVIIKGKVTDEKGEPLPGVSVRLKGTNIGTITDPEGNYSINLSDDKGVLQFAFVGFKTQEITVKGQTLINIKLIEDQEA